MSIFLIYLILSESTMTILMSDNFNTNYCFFVHLPTIKLYHQNLEFELKTTKRKSGGDLNEML